METERLVFLPGNTLWRFFNGWHRRDEQGAGHHEIHAAFQHLLHIPHVTIEDRDTVARALSNSQAGLDFVDALHHAAYRHCTSVASFDERGFAGRAKRLALAPPVTVPA